MLKPELELFVAFGHALSSAQEFRAMLEPALELVIGIRVNLAVDFPEIP
jgi:hypothetical protein